MPRGVFARPDRRCSIESCGRKHKARGFCSMHYEFHMREVDPIYRSKAAARMRASRARNVESGRRRSRISHLRRMYGLTVEEYDDMLDAQDGLCAVCGEEPDELAVDHDHQTGRVRGLLCHRCNVGLGHFRDNAEVMRRAAAYVDGWRP